MQDERRERLKRLLADKTEEEQENILGEDSPAFRKDKRLLVCRPCCCYFKHEADLSLEAFKVLQVARDLGAEPTEV